MLELDMEVHNKMLNDHLDMKDQLMMVDYEMVDLEYQQDYMLKDPNFKKNKIISSFFILF